MRRFVVFGSPIRFLVLVALAISAGVPAKALAQVAFHAVGDLPGGSFSSQVRDATKTGGVIYAVGSSSAQSPGCGSPCPVGDTAFLWRWDGTTATMTALPPLVVNTTATSFITASAITPDGAYIASRARSVAAGGARQAVRVTTALVPYPAANFNLSTLFTPALTPSTFANAISHDGSIVYGVNASGLAVRFDTAGSSSAVIGPLPGMATSGGAARGTSADGSVMVGTSGNPATRWAYRYVHASGTFAIPRLPGGTWNSADAVSPDGNLVLVAGDSPAFPNGEVYLYSSSTGTIVPLGSPNAPWSPAEGGFAGMTADGSVVAIGFSGQSRGFAYFRNSHGWFHLTRALADGGIDVRSQGWTELGVSGMSSDGRLVFGQGVHNGEVEGYVAEFPAGFLAAFDVPATAPTHTSIVGAWHANDTESGSPAIVVFMADGTYYVIQPTVQATEINAAPGLERGLYTWDASTGAFTVTTLFDTNGDAGLSDNNGMLDATLFVSGDTISQTDGGPALATRIAAPANTPLKDTLVGGWVVGDPATADGSTVAVFDNDGQYYFAQDGPADPGGQDGVEMGSYDWDASGHVLAATSIAVDTNGDWGLSDPIGPITFQPFIDGLSASAGDTTGLWTALRIIDPDSVTPLITSPLVATGTFGGAFTYGVTASHGAYQFEATPLPAGLSIDGATGLISGTPTVDGTFDVTLSASNSVRTGTAVLRITIVPAITRTGFYAPVSPVAGFVNVVKGGSTVPLKFNVYVNGVEKTDTAGLLFSVAQVGCAAATADPVDFVTTGGTILRYDAKAGQFVQNWQAPRTRGVCYIVRMTTVADGLSLSALFRTK